MNRRIHALAATLMFSGSMTLALAAALPASVLPAAASATTPPAAPPPADTAAIAPASAQASEPASLDRQVQEVKTDVIALNRDLLVLEEELLFPANTQFALFVSMDVGKMFELDSVQVKLDDKVVANYLYTAQETLALHRGGVQKLYLGNLRTGEHELVATFTGRGPHVRDYKRGASVKFTKDTQAKYVELRIQDSMQKLQPEFDIKIWQ